MKHSVRTIIVDDESDSREVLSHLLEAYAQLEIVGEAANIDDAYSKITAIKPDLVFLDIEMPKGDGLSLLKKFENVSFEVIFVTSYNQYAVNAIKLSALDYLLKPVIVEDLDFAVDKALRHIEQKRNTNEQIKALLERVTTENKGKKIMVHTNNQVKMIDASAILYTAALGRYCTLTLFDGLSYTIAKNLIEIEAELTDTKLFIRINKSLLINCKGILNYSKGKTCFVTMSNNQTFEISRRKKSEVITMLSAENGLASKI